MWGLVWGKVFMWDKLTRVLDVVFSFFGNIRDLIYWIACSSTLLNLHWWLTICEVLAEKKFLCETNRRQFQTLFFSNFENITDLIFYWRACSSTLLNLHCRLTICEVSSEKSFYVGQIDASSRRRFFPLFLTIEILLNIQTIKIWKTRTTSPSVWQVFLYDLIPGPRSSCHVSFSPRSDPRFHIPDLVSYPRSSCGVFLSFSLSGFPAKSAFTQ